MADSPLPAWVPLNWNLLSNPVNWVMIVLMVLLGTIVLLVIMGGIGLANKGDALP